MFFLLFDVLILVVPFPLIVLWEDLDVFFGNLVVPGAKTTQTLSLAFTATHVEQYY
jgi:hypothetical protein